MLLQFPAEPLRFRALRARAYDRFRWRYRVAVVRQFGVEAEDLGAYVGWCERCAEVSSVVVGFESLDPDLSLPALEDAIRLRAEEARDGWRPARCHHCGAPDPTPVAAFFGRFLPEAEVDLHLEMVFGGPRVVRVEHHLMSPDGRSARRPRPPGALAFLESFGAPLSVRALWSDFVDRAVGADRVTSQRAHAGYQLALRPFTDDPVEAGRMYEGFERLMDDLRADAPYDVVAFLRDREEHAIPVAEAESYHAWLGPYAHEIDEALIDPMVIADTDTFVAVLARQAALHDLHVSRASGEDQLRVRVGHGELHLSLNLGPLFFRILHEGLSFHRGLRRHFRRELQGLREAARLPPLLRAHLPGRVVRVGEGGALEVRDRAGARIFRGDLVGLSGDFDVHTDRGLDALLSHLTCGAA